MLPISAQNTAMSADTSTTTDLSRSYDTKQANSSDLPKERSYEPREMTAETSPDLGSANALNLTWAFGINRHVQVHNISGDNREAIFYVTAHTGVVYNYTTNRQKLLQGHCNNISCTCVSGNKRWLVTADSGKDTMVIIWDSYSSIPVRTIFEPHPNGCIAVAMTTDAKFLATLGIASPQVLSVWDWTNESDLPLCSLTLKEEYGLQNNISFSPNNSHELVSNSESQIIFYFWNEKQIHHAAPPLTDEDFNKVIGLFSQSIFQLNSTKVLTATSHGNIVVWDGASMDMPCNRKAFKIIRLQEKGISVLTAINSYIVTGDLVGHIKFLDLELRLLNWFNKLGGGPINSVSFSNIAATEEEIATGKHAQSATLEAKPFVVNEFVFSTSTANVGLFKPSKNANKFILKQHDTAVHAIATHPTEPRLCVGSYSGMLQLWDYDKRQLILTRSFGAKVFIQCLSFNSNGSLLAVGCTDGTVRILDGLTFQDEGEDETLAVFEHCHDCITHLTFSHNSKYLASADLDHCVTLFQFISEESSKYWLYLGKQRAHYKRITDIIFGVALDSDIPRLLSVGEDRLMIEYDVVNSGLDDVRLVSSDRIEQSAVPTCFGWYPPVVKESFLVVANNQYKLKLYNSTTKMCRKTLLGPTYGSPVRKLLSLPYKNDRNRHYMAYITTDKIGLQILPLDGNPHKAMALIAHPTDISDVVCSNDGRFVFTSGGPDTTVLMWQVNVDALEAGAQLGGEGLLPFYELLEGGKDGELMAEMEDYFYYALLRSQGVDTVDSRETSTKIVLAQVPYVMRALGYYPTEQEVEDMINEVKFSEYVDNGKYVDNIDLECLIKLYCNHRPVFGLSPWELHDAFNKLGDEDTQGVTIERDTLLSFLQNKGEHITEGELSELLSTLIGIAGLGGKTEEGRVTPEQDDLHSLLQNHLPARISAEMFAEKILGFGIEHVETE